MKLFNKNRVNQRKSSPPRQQRRAGGDINPSSIFRTVSRSTGANWANRIVKDFNDLTYNLNFTQFPSKQDVLPSPDKFRTRKNFGNQAFLYKLKRNQFRTNLMKQTRPQNPEKLSIIELDKYSTIQTQGLCKFQFEKTIAGQLRHKQHKHLNFKKQLKKQLSLSPERKTDSQKSSSKKKKFSQTISTFITSPKQHQLQIHSFKSYTPRRVFEPKETIDKMYNIDQFFTVARANRIKQTVKMSRLTGRKQQKIKVSSLLDYNQFSSRERVLRTARSFEISKSPRNTEIGKQVILSARGCYR